MRGGVWQIGIVGTFDVENYGDLLFPLVAEAELTARLGAVEMHRFSYRTRTPPEWPYAVTSVSALPALVGELDALLVGGGYLVRFDKYVADGYAPPAPAIHHPTGYWLTPALLALQHDVPLVWNAPGMHCNAIPPWADELLAIALSLSRYVAVRDEPSRAALVRHAGATPIEVVPDTAFGIARLLGDAPSNACTRLRAECGLTGRYVVLQAAGGLDPFVRCLTDRADFQVLALPLGPVLGNRVEQLGPAARDFVRLPTWPSPLLLAELVRDAEAVIGYSYHLAITALACGVPVFTPHRLHEGKFSALQPFTTIHPLLDDRPPDLDWLVARLGRTEPSPAARATLAALATHWDRVAAVVRAGRTDTSASLNRYWQSLPAILEDAAQAEEQAASALAEARAEISRRDDALAAAEARHAAAEARHAAALTAARAEIAERERRIAALNDTLSWKVTAPLRFVRDQVLGKKPYHG